VPQVLVETSALIKHKHTPAQTTLKRGARLKNMRGAFSLNPTVVATLKTARVFLIDDVTTTGTTLTEAAKTLKKSGIKCECIALTRAGS
jgi:predicted amidophosphoribosyltransferase